MIKPRATIRAKGTGQRPTNRGRPTKGFRLPLHHSKIRSFHNHRNTKGRRRLKLTFPAMTAIDTLWRTSHLITAGPALASAMQMGCIIRHGFRITFGLSTSAESSLLNQAPPSASGAVTGQSRAPSCPENIASVVSTKSCSVYV